MAEPRKAPARKRAPARKTASKPKPPTVEQAERTKILAAIKDGLEPERAALASGVKADAFAALMETDFADDVEQALAETELRLVRLLKDKDQAASARWTLERLFPARWSRPSVVQHLPGGTAAPAGAQPAEPEPAAGGGVVVSETELQRMRREREERERDAARRVREGKPG